MVSFPHLSIPGFTIQSSISFTFTNISVNIIKVGSAQRKTSLKNSVFIIVIIIIIKEYQRVLSSPEMILHCWYL